MSLTVKATGSGEDFQKLQPGRYEGTCFRIVDLGTRDKDFKGQVSKKEEIRLDFEITKAIDPVDNQVTMEDDRPFGVGKTYTASLFEMANLRKDLENWKDAVFSQAELDGFNVGDLIGMNARIEIGHTAPDPVRGFSGGNPKILKLSRPDGGMQETPTINPKVIFDLEDYCNNFNGKADEQSKAMVEVYDALPEYLQDEIAKSYEYKKAIGNSSEPSESEDLAKLNDQAAQEMNSPNFDDDEKKGGLTDEDIPF